MDFTEKQQIIRRIASGKLHALVPFQNDEYYVIFTDPSLELSTEADWIYKKRYKALVAEGALTLEQSYDILKRDGTWSDQLEKEYKTVEKDLDILNKHLPSVKFNKTEEKAIKSTITKGKKRLEELYRIKNQLITSTAEYLANLNKRRFIISRISKVDNPELLDIPMFKDTLIVYYFEESGISESQLRNIARSEPWRLYWTTSKDTGTPLFPHSAVEITDHQYMLVHWSRLYDFAYNSTRRPTNDIIDDDIRFDAWFKAEVDRIDADLKQQSIEDSMGGGSSGPGYTERFIPADEQGAKEVYELNDVMSRAKIAQRQKTIAKEGEVKEQNLPDVQASLQQEVNKATVQGIKNRSA
jgi:hypothetical protein